MHVNYDWNFSRLGPYIDAFVSGTYVTLTLTSVVIAIGTIAGVMIGVALRNPALRVLLYPVVDVLRALPPLVLLLFMYYLLTRQVIGLGVPAFWVAAIAMSLNLAAFTSDLVRAAVDNTPVATTDAARALGMSESQIMRHIVFPHVMREIIPGMTILYIGMLKMSSLASIINVREVVFTAQTVIANISRSLEAWVVVASIYVVMVIPASFGARAIERWARRGATLGGEL
jgi:polar amino acid transport system permease protein